MEILDLGKISKEEVIKKIVAVLQAGGLVVYPTETTYGIGADCENPAAMQRLLDYKGKRNNKPISVAVSDVRMAQKYVELNDTALNVYQTFLPGPVTVVSHKITGGTLGIRIPKYPLILEIISKFGHGITATGANASNQKRPYTISDIFTAISRSQKDLIDLVLDAGELPHNEPSTVIDTTLDDIKVQRMGQIQFAKKQIIETDSVQETVAAAQSLATQYRSFYTYTPIVFALTGEMGAGKTHFVKGLAAGLSIGDPVVSPTYTMASEYRFESESRPSLFVHIDTWRMSEAKELELIGIKKYIENNCVLAIEWADRFAIELEKLCRGAKIIWISLEDTGEFSRKITINYPPMAGQPWAD
ncbi:MAG TPA: L-threonylcarbamoyladenylate synthase [Patescibacteria group bacterium]|nr:L-threonylcarbamoyladenylate synthase [Patescibacteria group bacterium]